MATLYARSICFDLLSGAFERRRICPAVFDTCAVGVEIVSIRLKFIERVGTGVRSVFCWCVNRTYTTEFIERVRTGSFVFDLCSVGMEIIPIQFNRSSPFKRISHCSVTF